MEEKDLKLKFLENKLNLLNQIDNESEMSKCKQFTIDILEEYISSLMDMIELVQDDNIVNIESEIGVKSYKIDTILEIVDKSLPDYKVLSSMNIAFAS